MIVCVWPADMRAIMFGDPPLTLNDRKELVYLHFFFFQLQSHASASAIMLVAFRMVNYLRAIDLVT